MNLLNKNFNSQKYAVLDFDNTCIINDTGDVVLAYACEHNLLKKYSGKKAFLKYYSLLDKKKTKEAYEFNSKAFEGLTKKEIQLITKKAIKSTGNKPTSRYLFGRKINKGIRINKNVKILLDYLHKYNYQIWVVSASQKIVVETALNLLFSKYKIKCIGIENKIKKGMLTNQLVYPTSTYDGKVKCIQKYIDKIKRPAIAVGDSMNDLPMLEYSQMKFVVDRNNELTKIAKKNRWNILK